MDIERATGLGIKQAMLYTQKNLVPNKAFLEALVAKDDFNNDTISISNEARDLFDLNKSLLPNEENLNGLLEILDRLNDFSNSKDNPHTDFIKCILIAMRIMNGDRVPVKDEHFLLDKQPEMYLRAILLARQNDKPKKHDSLLEDEAGDSKVDSDSPISFGGLTESTSDESVSSDSVEISVEIEE